MKHVAAMAVAAMGLACGAPHDDRYWSLPQIDSPPVAVDAGPSLQILAVEPGAHGCEWRKRTVPDDTFTLVAELEGHCGSGSPRIETDGKFTLLQQDDVAWRVDRGTQRGTRLPAAPIEGAELGLTPDGAVACAIVVEEPRELTSGWLFTYEGVDYALDAPAEGGSSLARAWVLRGSAWEVAETGIVWSGSPDAGPPGCDRLESFADHLVFGSFDSSGGLETLDAESLEEVRRLTGMADAEFVGRGGDGGYAIQQDWCEGPCTIGPVYRRTGGQWAQVPELLGFEFVDGGVLAQTDAGYVLLDTSGKTVWTSPTRPFIWSE